MPRQARGGPPRSQPSSDSALRRTRASGLTLRPRCRHWTALRASQGLDSRLAQSNRCLPAHAANLLPLTRDPTPQPSLCGHSHAAIRVSNRIRVSTDAPEPSLPAPARWLAAYHECFPVMGKEVCAAWNHPTLLLIEAEASKVPSTATTGAEQVRYRKLKEAQQGMTQTGFGRMIRFIGWKFIGWK